MSSHQCPRPGCTRRVPMDMYACRSDWYALPVEIRTAIWRTWSAGDDAGHLAATTRARQWYRDNTVKEST